MLGCWRQTVFAKYWELATSILWAYSCECLAKTPSKSPSFGFSATTLPENSRKSFADGRRFDWFAVNRSHAGVGSVR